MLCDICHEGEATVHTSGAQEVPTSHFCLECFETRGPIAGVQLVEGVAQACHYCGADCDFGVSTGPAMSIVIPGAVSTCRKCGEDIHEYIDKHLQPFSTEEEFTRSLEVYMKKRVEERLPDA